MIFLDTSAIYALADTADPNHSQVKSFFHHALEDRQQFLVHNYILVESASLLQHRLGLETVLRFLRESSAFRTHWVTPQDHHQGVELLEGRGRRDFSLVDCVSFVVMRRLGVEEALACDADFAREGFELYQPERPQR